MPGGDGTGPGGMGPMTGRGAGYCAGYPVPGFMNPYGGRFGMGYGRGMGYGYGLGMGYGRGMGGGRGRRNWFYATGLPGDSPVVLTAIEFTLELQDWGELVRIFPVSS